MRYLLLWIFFAGLMVNGVAQKFNGGVLAGLSTSEISGDYITGPSKAGLYIGLFTSHYVSGKSSLQLELDFIQKGSRKNPDTLDLTRYILRLNYLTIMFLYKYDIKKFTFEIGPSFGYLVHSYEEADYFVLDNPFNPLDFSGELGLSYAISRNLRFNIRYSNTLFFPVRDEPSGYTYFLRKGQYNEVLSFTFHYTVFNTQR